MSLAPHPRARDEDEARKPDAEQVVARQQCDLGEAGLEPQGQDERVGCQQRRQGRGEDGEEAEDAGDDIAPPEGKVEGVEWGVGGLRDEDGAISGFLERDSGAGSGGGGGGEWVEIGERRGACVRGSVGQRGRGGPTVLWRA